jgi:hypothetical protein
MKSLFIAAVAVSLSGAALAAGDGDKQDDPKEQKICRTEKVTGSRLAKRRTCMTQAQWDQYEAANRQTVDRYTSRQSGRPADQTNPAAPR